jgi:hypothetical protein
MPIFNAKAERGKGAKFGIMLLKTAWERRRPAGQFFEEHAGGTPALPETACQASDLSSELPRLGVFALKISQ